MLSWTTRHIHRIEGAVDHMQWHSLLACLQVMPLELTGRLKKAIDASNVRFESEDVQDRMHISMHSHSGHGTTVADVLRLEYNVGDAIAALLPSATMKAYQQISTFVWKLKTMEFNLQRAFLV